MKLIRDLGMQYATENSKQKSRYGLYECPICYSKVRTQTAHVKNRVSTKCKSCSSKKKLTKHGMCGTRIYRVWKNMRTRCLNPSTEKDYKNYKERGISICDEWLNSFNSFHKWTLKNGYSEELTIDRINNDGNYEPANCRWTTLTVQARNTRLLNSKNTSGYRGITKTSNGKWQSQISVNNKKIRIGTFNTKKEGAIAYDKYVTDNNLEHTCNFT